MKANQFAVTIGGVKHTVVAFSPPDTEAPPRAVRTHHEFILDRSGSMDGSINHLIDQAQQLIDNIGPEDLLSVLWFSSPGKYQAVVIGAKAGDDVKKLLDALRSTVMFTCFSEVNGEALELTKRFSSLVDQTVVTFFTDGQIEGVPWGRPEDAQRTRSLIQQMTEHGLSAYHTIGYGWYYDQKLLAEFSAISSQGRAVHSSAIGEFLETAKENMGTAGKTVPKKVEIIAENPGAEVLYIGERASKLSGRMLTMNFQTQGANTIYIVEGLKFNGAKVAYAGDIADVSNPEVTMDEGIKHDFLFAYAHQLYVGGERQKALDILVNNVHDKALANIVMNAFTPDEVGDAAKALERAALLGNHPAAYRYAEGRTGPGFLPAKDAFCVMDVFQMLFEASKDDALFIPYSKNVAAYNRIGRKVTDTQSTFKASEEEIRQPLNGLVWNKDQVNLGVRFTIPGKVTLNKKAAENANLPMEIDGIKAFRTFSIVKDGNINMPQMEFLLDPTLVADLTAKKSGLVQYVEDVNVGNKLMKRVILHLKKLPIVNRKTVEEADDLPSLYTLVKEMGVLQAQQKVLNHLIEGAKEKSANFQKFDFFAGKTADQIRVLQEHGISDQGAYAGVNRETAKVAECDFYEARTMSFYLKGWASLPSTADFELMLGGKKKPNGPGGVMVEYHKILLARLIEKKLDLKKPTNALRDFLFKESEFIEGMLQATRQKLNAVKLAKTLTFDFYHGLTQDEKGNFSWAPSATAPPMILRQDFKKVYIDKPAEGAAEDEALAA